MTPTERQKLHESCDISSAQRAVQQIENMKNGLILIYQQHMAGNPAFPRGMVERAKMIIEKFLVLLGISLDYKKPQENKLAS